jgi:hypothetical protein
MRALAAGELGRMLEALELAGTDLGKAMKLARALEGMKLELGRLEQGEGTVWDDREALMAAWEHLQTAQLCLGSGAGWAACRSRIPGSGPSGRPGSGVGTWADEASALNEVEPIGLWDNSGIARPEMEGRGHTDRGAGRVSDALVPTQAKGQLRAGRPMPAVTLRGLSVRGQSGVDYEEVVTAAQVEAQSALSQERVPRAYRGAVRRYFDEIRE